jgi:hypothetical protein
MADEQRKPKTIWIQRDGYSIELTEDEVRRAYAQCGEKPKPDAKNAYDHGRAVSQMTTDIYQTLDDIAYAVRQRHPELSGPFGNN